MELNEITEKEGFIYNFINEIADALATQGAIFYDIVIEDLLGGMVYKYHGKAFSIDGTNFFGFTYNDDKVPEMLAQHGVIVADKAFAGSYVQGKGLSVYLLPQMNYLLKKDNVDLSLNATNRPGRSKLHGKFWIDAARVDIKPETGEVSAETHLDPFIDYVAYMTNFYPDKAYALAAKGLSQEENVALIEKLYPKLQDAPILSVFADDGETPKTKS